MYAKPMLRRTPGRRILAVPLVIGFLASNVARADGPTVDPRVVIARGNGYPTPDRLEPVWEVDPAAAQDWAIRSG